MRVGRTGRSDKYNVNCTSYVKSSFTPQTKGAMNHLFLNFDVLGRGYL